MKGQFLRLSDKKPGEQVSGERLTVGQVADRVAEIFGKGTCKQPDKPDVYKVSADPTISLKQQAADYLSAKYHGSGGVAELAELFGVQDLCPATLAPSGKKTLPVYVHASSDAVFEDYRLVSYGSASSGPKIIEEDIQIRFEFTRSAGLSIKYYIDYEKLDKYLESPLLYGEIFEWRGDPKNNRGERVDPPEVRISDGQVLLHGYYSGILVLRRLPIKYHKYMITIIGTALEDGKREYKGRVSAISSAFGLGPVDQQLGEAEAVQDKAADCPLEEDNPLATDKTGAVVVCSRDSSGELVCSGGDGEDDGPKGKDIFCFIEVKKELVQQCTGDYIGDLPTEYRAASCPDGLTPTRNSPAALNYNPALPEYYHRIKTVTEPVYTQEGTERQISETEYESVCCHAPEKQECVPYCRKIVSTYTGSVEIEGGRQKYIDQYPGKTVFVPVGTEEGPCGTLTDKFVEPGGECCTGGNIVIDTDNSAETVAPSSSASIFWSGGESKIKIEVVGQGFWLDTSHTDKEAEVANSNGLTIYTDEENCGTGVITLDDGCSTASLGIRSTSGQWSLVEQVPVSPGTCGEGEGGMGQTGESVGCVEGGVKITRTWCAVYGYQNCVDLKEGGGFYDTYGCDGDSPGVPGTGKVFCFIISINTYNWIC